MSHSRRCWRQQVTEAQLALAGLVGELWICFDAVVNDWASWSCQLHISHVEDTFDNWPHAHHYSWHISEDVTLGSPWYCAQASSVHFLLGVCSENWHVRRIGTCSTERAVRPNFSILKVWYISVWMLRIRVMLVSASARMVNTGSFLFIWVVLSNVAGNPCKTNFLGLSLLKPKEWKEYFLSSNRAQMASWCSLVFG